MAAGEEIVLASVKVVPEDVEKFKAISVAQFGVGAYGRPTTVYDDGPTQWMKRYVRLHSLH